MKAKTKEKAIRAWLNPRVHSDTGSSAIKSTINTDKIKLNDSDKADTTKNYLPSLDMQWNIWDCSRKVVLDFCVYGDHTTTTGIKFTLKEIDNRRKKIELLKDHIQFLEDQFNEYEDDVNEYLEELKQYEQVTSKRTRKDPLF